MVAEGVETDQQVRFLKRHGCDELQGFFYASGGARGLRVPAREGETQGRADE